LRRGVGQDELQRPVAAGAGGRGGGGAGGGGGGGGVCGPGRGANPGAFFPRRPGQHQPPRPRGARAAPQPAPGAGAGHPHAALGTGTVIGLYLLANVAYLVVLPFAEVQHAEADRVGTAMLKRIFPGAGVAVMAVAIMVSTFGCTNGLILAGARAYYAMARDG